MSKFFNELLSTCPDHTLVHFLLRTFETPLKRLEPRAGLRRFQAYALRPGWLIITFNRSSNRQPYVFEKASDDSALSVFSS